MTLKQALRRRKRLDTATMGETKLARVLTTIDLTALGVGSTLGVGIYVLAGEVSKTTAGPAVLLSFLLAAVASLFAGLCYAEFGARIPKAGSVYVYSYYCLGEFIAFIMGWTLILEYVIGTASVARGLSTYIDSLTNNSIRENFQSVAPIYADGFLSPYCDFLALGLILVLSLALAFGVRESAIVNNVFTLLNVGIVLFVIIAGATQGDVENWKKEPADFPADVTDAGDGGFLPFGFIGVLKGAAICFYGFVGFDCIATTGEEVKNPQKAIPISILASLFIVFLAYSGISTVLTLMWPYYLQDEDAPIPYAFMAIGWDAARWVVTVGGIFGLMASLFGAMFPLPRIVYAMSNDGLLFSFLGKVHPKFQTPWIGTLTVGALTSILAAIFDLQQLVNLTSMGTLLAYTMIAICVVILRYRSDENIPSEQNSFTYGEATNLVTLKTRPPMRDIKRQFVNLSKLSTPDTTSSLVVLIQIILYCAFAIGLSLTFLFLGESLSNGGGLAIALTCIFLILMITIVVLIYLQPTSQKILPFKMPWVPVLPCLSIFINIYLMILLDGNTWIRFAFWMAVGIVPYFCWYIWKCKHGALGPNSRYEVSRVNFISLNETVRKVRENVRANKKLIKSGFVNDAFIFDEPKPMPIPDVLVFIEHPTPRPSDFTVYEKEPGMQMESDEWSKSTKNDEVLQTTESNLKQQDEADDKIDSLVTASYGFLSDEESDEVDAKEDLKNAVEELETSPETGEKLLVVKNAETLGKYSAIRETLTSLFSQQRPVSGQIVKREQRATVENSEIFALPIPPIPIFDKPEDKNEEVVIPIPPPMMMDDGPEGHIPKPPPMYLTLEKKQTDTVKVKKEPKVEEPKFEQKNEIVEDNKNDIPTKTEIKKKLEFMLLDRAQKEGTVKIKPVENIIEVIPVEEQEKIPVEPAKPKPTIVPEEKMVKARPFKPKPTIVPEKQTVTAGPFKPKPTIVPEKHTVTAGPFKPKPTIVPEKQTVTPGPFKSKPTIVPEEKPVIAGPLKSKPAIKQKPSLEKINLEKPLVTVKPKTDNQNKVKDMIKQMERKGSEKEIEINKPKVGVLQKNESIASRRNMFLNSVKQSESFNKTKDIKQGSIT